MDCPHCQQRMTVGVAHPTMRVWRCEACAQLKLPNYDGTIVINRHVPGPWNDVRILH